MIKSNQIVSDLKKLGIVENDILLIHSSLKSLGRVEGGADSVVEAFLEAVAPEGSILVPTFTGDNSLSPENPPVFDPQNTPSWTGAICEALRKREDSQRSLHPTHSLAGIGNEIGFLLKNHHLAKTPCGKGSPFIRFAELEGKILFLGTDLECCTFFHTVEELTESHYHLQEQPVMAKILVEGKEIQLPFLIHRYGFPRNFMGLYEGLKNQRILEEGMVGNAKTLIVDAKKLIKFTLEKISKDPNVLLAN